MTKYYILCSEELHDFAVITACPFFDAMSLALAVKQKQCSMADLSFYFDYFS